MENTVKAHGKTAAMKVERYVRVFVVCVCVLL